jgi:hypothetical protein
MLVPKPKPLAFLRVLAVFILGLISGAQIALYLYDYYDDGVADPRSLLIGIVMVGFSVGFIFYSFARKPEGAPGPDRGRD